MKPEAFELLRHAEMSWWYEARAHVVKNILDEKRISGSILDLGCGFGGMQPFLKAYGNVFGIEPNMEAAKICRERGYQNVFSNIQEVAESGLRFDLIGAFDSLEHIQDDAALLASLKPIMKENGSLLINVPAYPSLWSSHDVQHEHYRRYTAASLEKLLEANGYRVVYIGYWNFILFPLFALSRLIGVGGESSMSSTMLNGIFRLILKTEVRCIPRFALPFGSSVIALAVLR
ncbi:class I SAM-dependent methyltransferase [Candidatus Uhrbacteria bacterium]|nr:class I SAM-dependent methyltransferase [Candidatus Uhrbacteria bacterium]